MRVVINIPKEFEEHYKENRLVDSLERMEYDLFERGGKSLSSRYEHEILKMIKEGLKTAIELPEKHGRLIDAGALIKDKTKLVNNAYGIGMTGVYLEKISREDIMNAPTILESEE